MSSSVLAPKLFFLTGASSGIGAAIAQEAARRGARLALHGSDPKRLQEVAAAVQAAGAAAYTYSADLSDHESIAKLAANFQRELGTPDVLVNNAGAGCWEFLEQTAWEEVDRSIRVPYLAAAWLTQAFLPGMLARRTGHIVNVSSIGGFLAWPGATSYLAARWAMRGLHEALQADLDGTGVGETLLATGTVRTEYFARNEVTPPNPSKLVPLLSPAEVAVAALNAVERGRSLVILPPALRFFVRLHKLFPRTVNRMMRQTGKERVKEVQPDLVTV
jgi:short-subunit dehydrogenase